MNFHRFSLSVIIISFLIIINFRVQVTDINLFDFDLWPMIFWDYDILGLYFGIMIFWDNDILGLCGDLPA